MNMNAIRARLLKKKQNTFPPPFRGRVREGVKTLFSALMLFPPHPSLPPARGKETTKGARYG